MNAPAIRPHRLLRWLVQIAFLTFFVFLFVQTRYGSPARVKDILFRFDPLVLLITSITHRTLINAALLSISVIAITFVFGRFFCGFVCPLGTTLDICDGITRHKTRLRRSLRNWKYFLLLFLLVSAVLGVSFLHFFDPLVIFERSLTLVFYPVFTYLFGLFTDLSPMVYTETLVAFGVFALILGSGFLAPRFWCRNLCPLGGLLGLLSRLSPFRFSFQEQCSCGICETVCPTGAIDSSRNLINPAECIDCLRCRYECPRHAITYGLHLSLVPFDAKKRHWIIAFGAGLVFASLRPLLQQRLHGRLIRPPGAVPEADFLNLCLHCGKCMKVCPTNGLQPCILEAGINGIWTPRLVPRIGGCEKNCNMCGRVCPTSAIRTLSLREKTFAKIGTAVIDRHRCIAWEQNMVCLICDEVCQYNAISSFSETIQGTTLLRPFVDERICTGCGICESRCPVEGAAAIQVFSKGEERKRTGSYITEEKVKLRACEEKPEDIPSGFIQDDN